MRCYYRNRERITVGRRRFHTPGAIFRVRLLCSTNSDGAEKGRVEHLVKSFPNKRKYICFIWANDRLTVYRGVLVTLYYTRYGTQELTRESTPRPRAVWPRPHSTVFWQLQQGVPITGCSSRVPPFLSPLSRSIVAKYCAQTLGLMRLRTIQLTDHVRIGCRTPKHDCTGVLFFATVR